MCGKGSDIKQEFTHRRFLKKPNAREASSDFGMEKLLILLSLFYFVAQEKWQTLLETRRILDMLQCAILPWPSECVHM